MIETQNRISIAKVIGLLLPMITLRWGVGDYSFTLYMLIMTITSLYLLIVSKKRVLINSSDLYVYIFMFIAFTSILYSVNMSYGLSRFIKFALVIVLYFIYKSAYKNHTKLIEIILRYSVYGATIMLIYLAYIYLIKFDVNYIGIITEFPTRGSKNSLAFVVAIVSAFLVSDFLTTLRIRGRHLLKSLLLAINIILGFAIQSRALFLVIGFYLMFSIINVIGKRKMVKSTIGFFFVLIVLVIFLPENLKSSVYERFMTLSFLFENEAIVENYSVSTRTDLLVKGLNIFKENPIFGAGLGSFMEYGGVITHISHNDYLLVLSEQGILGLISFLILILSNIFQAYRNMKFENNFTNTGLFLSICGVSIYFLFINAYDNVLFWTILAFINAITLSNKEIILNVRKKYSEANKKSDYKAEVYNEINTK